MIHAHIPNRTMRKQFCSSSLLPLFLLPFLYTLHHDFHHLRYTPAFFPYESDPAQNLTQVYDILIKPYIKWHTATRQALRLASPANLPHVRILVIRTDRTITHGLGDRFRGIMHCFMCAVLSQRLFLVQWTDPVPLHNVLRLGRRAEELNFTFDSTLFASNGPVLEGDCFYQHKREKYDVDALFVDSVPRPNVSLWLNAPDPMKGRHKVLSELAEVVPVPTEKEVMSLIMHVLFDPTPELRQYLTRHVKLLSISPERQRYVSIHARLGYGLDEIRKAGQRFDLSMKGMNLSTMARCFADRAVRHAAQLGIQKPLFYLATDTPPFRTMLTSAIENELKGARVVSGEWNITHVRDATDRTGIEPYMNGFLDIYLLSRGRSILHLKSGFADLATWMGVIRETERIEYKQCVGY